jgi:hypothetical protein
MTNRSSDRRRFASVGPLARYTDRMRLARHHLSSILHLSLLLTLTIAAAAGTHLPAQTSQQPANQQPATIPPATPVPASSIPSIPAPTPGTLESAPPSSQPQTAPPSVSAPTPQQTEPAIPAAAPPPSQQPQNPQPATTANPPDATRPNQSSPDELEKPIQVPAVSPATQVTMPPAATVASVPGLPAYQAPVPETAHTDALGSTYIPLDSMVYPMAMRLYSMGYLNEAFINMRPWTRRSLLHMLQKTTDDVMAEGNPEAEAILARLEEYIVEETPSPNLRRGEVWGVDTAYARPMGIAGSTLRDSYHLGQSIENDYGRPYAPGFNFIGGFSSINEAGRFSLYFRGEYQHAPAGPGYSLALANQLSCLDEICPFAPPNAPQDTIPYGNTGTVNTFSIQEATLSFHWWGHEISGGKSDDWEGPAMGGGMAWSNNAQDIYSFRINRVDPWYIPWVSKLLGPVRYDFFFGSLKGHTFPNSPYIHNEMFTFRPTVNFEFGFQRSIIWGGEGHEPVTLHTFFQSFFSFSDTTASEKYSDKDPGARYSAFNFSYRLPFLRRWVTLYTDSICHDDVTPISAPRRAAYRPGVYLSHVPGLPKLDFRAEASSTDTSTLRSLNGQFNYYEIVQRQGYTNKGIIMGDWIGREAKGGNAWLTWHLSPDQWIQLEYMNKKTPKDFIPGGTTQNQFTVDVVKRFHKDIELNAWLQYEHWKAPIYVAGPQNDTTIAVQVKFFPKLHTMPQPIAK